MSTLADTYSTHAIQLDNPRVGLDQVLTLVQDQLVISIFPGHQLGAALDLARVLCRALTRPVELYRLRRVDAEQVRSGMAALMDDPSWILLAQVRPSLVGNIKVEIYDAELRIEHDR